MGINHCLACAFLEILDLSEASLACAHLPHTPHASKVSPQGQFILHTPSLDRENKLFLYLIIIYGFITIFTDAELFSYRTVLPMITIEINLTERTVNTVKLIFTIFQIVINLVYDALSLHIFYACQKNGLPRSFCKYPKTKLLNL